MPQILAIFGLRVVIYYNDHQPPHVHVLGKGCEAIFNLHCPNGPPSIRENYQFSHKELNKISNELNMHLALLCQNWRKLHGNY